MLEGIDLEIRAGELVSLVGPNGAGKTTLMRCLSDGTEPFTGAIAIGGTPITGLTPNRIVGLGVGRKFQVASVFESLSVADCLRLARAPHDGLNPVGRAATLGLPQAALDVLRDDRPRPPADAADARSCRTARSRRWNSPWWWRWSRG